MQLFFRPHPVRAPATAFPRAVWDDAKQFAAFEESVNSPNAAQAAQDKDRLFAMTVKEGGDGDCAVVTAQWRDAETVVVVDAEVSRRAQRCGLRASCLVWRVLPASRARAANNSQIRSFFGPDSLVLCHGNAFQVPLRTIHKTRPCRLSPEPPSGQRGRGDGSGGAMRRLWGAGGAECERGAHEEGGLEHH
jgi:hypothetical protein